ncbi:ABC transporter ATP-binding protein [Salinarimonas soli]|uniref:ABC transporter ATP-binding protein n=1 Tax=Salinarimonas soli TaxID=1638099 RepID=A0A5B2VDF3_9HYPH|nr:ABC transporter ATP-binding protein [Salinarimonas soli]KAA2236768.1 ABC transporter ATP-binding protein [Salinarimonas soli]
MDYLAVENASKTFGGGVRALDGVSFSVERDEFFTLLGPSGCGKTTLLRSIAGFADLTEGTITLDGARLDRTPPHRRDIGMVFQDYAVFPHLTVAENVAFGLKARKTPAAESAARVAEALATVRLGALAARLPAALSGGQQQRIGLARAMVIRPKLLLMDEPLSNLDAKLRIELRDEIRDIQKSVGTAAIYVTHDQEEALAISDRICVMNAGRIEQIGTPQEIYADPRTIFVASFVGTMNVTPWDAAGPGFPPGFAPDRAHVWAIRPEHLRIGEGRPGAVAIRGEVDKYTYLGREAHVAVRTPDGRFVIQVADPAPGLRMQPGTPVSVGFDPANALFFDEAGRRVATTRTS